MKLVTFDKRILNVSLLFLVAYAIVHLTYLIFVYFCATWIEVADVKYYFSYISYDISEYTDWTRTKIIVLFGFPTFLMLVMAGIYWVAMKAFSFADAARLKLFFLWLILISLGFFIADFVSAPYYRYSMAVVAEWYYMTKETVFGFSLIFWAVIPLISYYSSKSFIKLANSRTYLVTKWTRLFFLLNNVLLPFSVGSVIFSVLIILTPGYNLEYYFSIDFMRFFVVSLILLFVMVFNFHKRYVGIKRTRDLEQVSYPLLIFVVVVFMVIYIGLYFT